MKRASLLGCLGGLLTANHDLLLAMLFAGQDSFLLLMAYRLLLRVGQVCTKLLLLLLCLKTDGLQASVFLRGRPARLSRRVTVLKLLAASQVLI